ncbi:class C beta-lactamase [Falsirhodobacter sp. 20TX0035]|uniref:class C beta-lactamase n=1 Tax=Falsirhodobacter sp. 20TX0035 TaxID=3022019 RepID=UPI0023307583|nr:class C beta-lactamase [Falsirhodobacter sp. 20TX0035]MDB6452714.1 beta-lactamase [Falsirhodobacter sp. 20TX0035]
MKRFPILGLALALLAAPAHARDLTDDQFHDIAEDIFRPLMQELDIPGLAIGVTLDGRPHVFAEGFADRDTRRPVDADTLFELGSVSKLFNVALAALAEEEGLLSLDAPVSQERPALKGSAFDRITLNDLAAHATGGLPLQVPEGIVDDASLNDYLAHWTPEGDPPQTLRSYSNVSIGLLGRITADRFGASYDTALSEHLLPALGLNSTFVTVPEEAMDRYAFGYSRTGAPVRVNPGMLDAEAYGIRSTVTDMTRFLDAHLGNLDLPEPVDAALARTRVAGYDTAHFAQGMIWEGYPWPVDPAQLAAGNAPEMALTPQPLTRHDPQALQGLLNKTGATNGFGAYVAMVPSERIGVVVLANRNYPNPVRAEATRRLIHDLLQAARD